MNMTTSRFIEHRQNALATVFLTAREDVQVIIADLGGGIDLIAEILSDDSRTSMFGVVVKGTSRPIPTEKHASRYVNDELKRSKSAQAFPFPIIVLAFSMKDDDGYYAWLAEPDVSPEGLPRLESRKDIICRRATRQALESIVERVQEWHRSLYSLLLDDARNLSPRV